MRGWSVARFRSRVEALQRRVLVGTCCKCRHRYEYKTKMEKPTNCRCGSTDLWFFPSRIQSTRWAELLTLADHDLIRSPTHEVVFPIIINSIRCGSFRVDAMYYQPAVDDDWSQGQKLIYEDVKAKGAPLSRDWARVRKIVEALYGVSITICER